MKYDLSNKKILIVEDEDINFMILDLYFKDYNLNMDRCIDSEDFYKIFNNDYDLIFLDIRIPCELLGIDLLAYARESGFTKPIIIQTAYREYYQEAIDLGVTEYLEKPISDKHLDKIINKYLL